MRRKPDLKALVDCCKALARLLSVPPAPEHEIRSKIKNILFNQKGLLHFQMGLITREELRNLLIFHLQTLICRHAGAAEPTKPWKAPRLCRAMDRALCDNDRLDKNGFSKK